jgi:hypothetical protein
MIKKLDARSAVMAVFLAASVASDAAFAILEIEPNNTITTAQHLVIGSGGSVEVNGSLGAVVSSVSATVDVDFYSFDGREGDMVTVDIDGGIKPAGSALRSVDTILAVFGPGPTFTKLCENDDGGFPLDPGSISPFDARIDNPPCRLPVTGTYTVAVSSWPNFIRSGGLSTVTGLNGKSNGSYTLIISGVTPAVQQINIEIKPGSGEFAPVNPKAKGSIPVALLSSAQFNALEVDYPSLRFGATGNEISWVRCDKDGTDVDGDGRLDLVCHFDNQAAGFDAGDLSGIVRGKTADGRPFEGRGLLKVVPGKRQF